jgi:hypothetical protein
MSAETISLHRARCERDHKFRFIGSEFDDEAGIEDVCRLGRRSSVFQKALDRAKDNHFWGTCQALEELGRACDLVIALERLEVARLRAEANLQPTTP